MQRAEQKSLENQQEESQNISFTFSKIRNKLTHTNQHQNEIIRQIVQISPKKIENRSSEDIYLQQTPKLTQSRREIKHHTTRLKLKDYIRLNEISRQKRSQSASSNSLKSNKTFEEEKSFNLEATFVPKLESKKVQQQNIVQKKPPKPYQKQIQLEKEHLLLTSQKVRQKLDNILHLIDESKHKFSGYNDLVFMFSIEEMLKNEILNGLQKINKAFDGHFADKNENNSKSIKNKIENLSSSRSKQIQHMSPALRAQFRALQEIHSIKKPSIPLSKRPSITQFNPNESRNQKNPQIILRPKS